MFKEIISQIKSYDRGEWAQLIRDKITDFRVLIQENGELSAGVAFFTGIIFVLAFKLILMLIIVALLIALICYNLCDPSRPKDFSS